MVDERGKRNWRETAATTAAAAAAAAAAIG